MADTTFKTVNPPFKAVDNGDGTYSVAVSILNPVAGTDLTFTHTIPLVKAVDNGDGTYLLKIVCS